MNIEIARPQDDRAELLAIIRELVDWQAGIPEFLPDGLGDRIAAVLEKENL